MLRKKTGISSVSKEQSNPHNNVEKQKQAMRLVQRVPSVTEYLGNAHVNNRKLQTMHSNTIGESNNFT